MQNLLSMGHTKVEHLRDAYEAKFKQAAHFAAAANGHTNGHVDDEDEDDPFADPSQAKKADRKTGLHIRSLQELDEVLVRLIQSELVSCVSESCFRSWDDTRKAEEDKIRNEYFSGGVRGAKGTEDFNNKVSKRLREVRDEPLSLKGRVQAKSQVNKRRKLSEWNSVNTDRDDDNDFTISVSLDQCFL